MNLLDSFDFLNECFREEFFSVSALPEIPGYRILACVGKGGMGLVYRAQEEDPPHREVAIKLIHRKLQNAGNHRRFQQEISFLAKIDHPAVCRIITAGQTSQAEFYYVMEFVEGISLDRYLDAQGQDLTRSQRLKFSLSICEAVQACHAAGIIHRDLSPANILVTRDGRPKLLDFGIAAIPEERERLGSTRFVGTPGFSSPEQHKEDAVAGSAADVFVLGLWVARICGGSFPFGADDTLMLTAAPRLDRQILGRELESVIRKSLHRDPQQRHSSAGELATDLRNLINHQPVSTRPLTFSYFLQKLISRNRVAASALGAVLLVSFLIGWTIHQGRKAAVAEAERIRIEKLSNELVLAAKAKGVQGDWEGALATLETALASGHSSPDFVRLEMIKATVAAGRPERAVKLLSGLQEESALKDYWAAHLTDNLDEALLLIQSARAKGLPDCEDLIAQSYLSSGSTEAKGYLQEALAIDPRSQQANLHLCAHQLWTHENDEALRRIRAARYLFPDDAQWDVLYLMATKIDADGSDFGDLLSEISEKRGKEFADQAEMIVKGLNAWSILYETYSGTVSPAKMLFFEQMMPSALAKDSAGFPKLSPLASRIIEQSFPDMSEVVKILFNRSDLALVRGTLEQELGRDPPRDMMLTVSLVTYFALSGMGLEEPREFALFEKAARTCLAVSRIPATRAIALELLASAYFIAANRTLHPHAEKGRDLVMERLEMDLPLAPNSGRLFLIAAGKYELVSMADSVVEALRESEPENVEWIFHEIERDQRNGFYFAALKKLLDLSSSTEEQEELIRERRTILLEKIAVEAEKVLGIKNIAEE